MDINVIQKLLYDKRRSQSWLSDETGISKNSIGKICRNESQPKADTLLNIAKALNVTPCQLLITVEEYEQLLEDQQSK